MSRELSIRSLRKEFYGAVASWRFATHNSILKALRNPVQKNQSWLLQFFSNLFGHGHPFLHQEALKCCSPIRYKYLQSSFYFAAMSIYHACDLTVDLVSYLSRPAGLIHPRSITTAGMTSLLVTDISLQISSAVFLACKKWRNMGND